jgi:hypothetical protein
MNYRSVLFIVIFFIFLNLSTVNTFAADYVLPYPSFFPGSFFYKPKVLIDQISKYWYFGNFGQFEYNLKQSDKYLVQAKTLFEYNQYLLGVDALRKSNNYFSKVSPYLDKAEEKGENTIQKRSVLKSAAQKHIEVLFTIEKETPQIFVWNPEKGNSTTLYLKKELDNAISQRKKFL